MNYAYNHSYLFNHVDLGKYKMIFFYWINGQAALEFICLGYATS